MKTISVAELQERLSQQQQPLLLDVRQPEEHADFHLEGSILIPLGELADRLGELEHAQNSEIVVYCRSGNRSGQACMLLEAAGFTNPVNLTGGMLAWK
jgi:rhodanese-related sulfurtransferase